MKVKQQEPHATQGPLFSRVSKHDGIRSWSLEAGATCPGSFTHEGEQVDACQGCYAKGGNYQRFPHVNQRRRHNKSDWQRAGWVADMVMALDNDRYFRWFDSGDIYHPHLAKKILAVCQQTPWVKHWIPTRSHKVKAIRPLLEALKRLPNVAVRYSSDSIEGRYSEIHGSTIIPTRVSEDKRLTLCQALENRGCQGCRLCWDPKIKIIAYPAHGRAMLKQVRLKTIDSL